MPRPPLAPALAATDAEIRARAGSLTDFASLAALLEVPPYVLKYVLDRVDAKCAYREFTIPKRSGGTRAISAPCGSIAILQKKVARVLEVLHEPKPPCHGFTKGRGIVSNARPHAGRRWVLNIDLKDFFPSIHFGRVQGALASPPFKFPIRVASAVARLVCRGGTLPQGSPASPILSNIVARHLDAKLLMLARAQRLHYTRYADDITLSTNRRKFPRDVARPVRRGGRRVHKAGSELAEAIRSAGFTINRRKVTLSDHSGRQEVTGLVVNRQTNVRRSVVRRVRAQLHAWKKFGYKAAAQDFRRKYRTRLRAKNPERKPATLKNHVRGAIEFMRMVRGDLWPPYLRLRARLAHLDPTVTPPPRMHMELLKDTQYDVFICHASEDKGGLVTPLARALKKAGVRVWFDESEISWGDSIVTAINQGLAHSTLVLPVISRAFLAKSWPLKELGVALQREINSGHTRVLPLLVGTDDDVQYALTQLPLLSDKLYQRLVPRRRGRIVAAVKDRLKTEAKRATAGRSRDATAAPKGKTKSGATMRSRRPKR